MSIDVASARRRGVLVCNIERLSLNPADLAFEANPSRFAVLAENATADSCAPIAQFWRGGPEFTADCLVSGKPPTEVIEASKQLRAMLWAWCAKAQASFPTLQAPNAKISFALAISMMRLGNSRTRSQSFTHALAEPDAKELLTSMLLNRGLSWHELGFSEKAIFDYDQVLENPGLERDTRRDTSLLNRAIAWSKLGKHRKVEADLEEILSCPQVDVLHTASALISRALLKCDTNNLQAAIADYDRVNHTEKCSGDSTC